MAGNRGPKCGKPSCAPSDPNSRLGLDRLLMDHAKTHTVTNTNKEMILNLKIVNDKIYDMIMLVKNNELGGSKDSDFIEILGF